MEVAITGGTGFVGRALVLRHLAAGDTVRVLSRRSSNQNGFPDAVKLYSGDLVFAGNSASLSHFVEGQDVIYHRAGEITHSDSVWPWHEEPVSEPADRDD